MGSKPARLTTTRATDHRVGRAASAKSGGTFGSGQLARGTPGRVLLALGSWARRRSPVSVRASRPRATCWSGGTRRSCNREGHRGSLVPRGRAPDQAWRVGQEGQRLPVVNRKTLAAPAGGRRQVVPVAHQHRVPAAPVHRVQPARTQEDRAPRAADPQPPIRPVLLALRAADLEARSHRVPPGRPQAVPGPRLRMDL